MKYSWIQVTEASNPKTGIEPPSALDYMLNVTNERLWNLDAARAELAQLRADLHAAQERIAWLTSDIGESGLAAINRLIAACERGDIAQQASVDLSIARDEILRQARQLDKAIEIMNLARAALRFDSIARIRMDNWLAENPAPPQESQP